jgi:RHS repeat-associated protein
MLCLSWLVGVVRSKVGCQQGSRARRIGGMVGILLLVVLALPTWASAATCTDTWTGPAEGSWNTAADWSLGTVPTSSDVACIGPKTTVESFEANNAGVLQVEGTLVISGGSLEVTNALEASTIATLTMTGGALKGAGTVDVSGSFTSAYAEMRGAGLTVILPGASASIGVAGGVLELVERTLVNEGTLTLGEGKLSENEGARVENSGTFIANADEGTGQIGNPTGTASFVNKGIFKKTAGTKHTEIGVYFENLGTVNAATGSFRFSKGNATWATGSILEGTIEVVGFGLAEEVTGDSFAAKNATLDLAGTGVINVGEGTSATIGNLTIEGGTLTGAGTIEVSGALTWSGGSMDGSGSTVILHDATGLIGPEEGVVVGITERTFINEGVVTFSGGHIDMENDAEIININTFKADSEVASTGSSIGVTAGKPFIQNFGLFEKTAGTGKTTVAPYFESLGAVVAYTGKLEFANPVRQLTAAQFAERSPSSHLSRCEYSDPVNCATGNFYETQTDLAVGGRGVGLNLTRTYNSMAAAEGTTGIFGHGWSNSFGDHVVAEKEAVTVYHGNGSAVPFKETKGGGFIAPSWTQDKLTGNSTIGYSLILENQVKYQFEGSTGRLQSVTDRNGNQTTLAYNKAGQLETITDPAGRKITLAYNGEGLVESAKDPLGHTAKYTYAEGTLASVTLPGEAKARWQYHYGEAHQMTSMIDGRGDETTNEYNGSHELTSQTDPAGHKVKFEREPFHAKLTNNGTGSVTNEWFNSNGEPTSITRGYGTASETTETFSYDTSGNLLSKTDGNGHTSTWTYDSENNMTSKTDADNNQTKWTYDGTHDVMAKTTPNGETTTVTRDSHGNTETVSRPAPGKGTQLSTYHYDANGNLTSVVDALKHTWGYEYDKFGNRTSETDPEGNKRTYGYDEDSRETSRVSPAGNVKGAEASQYTTKIERDTQERVTKATDPLGHTTKYTYDGNGNVETFTDGEGHKTTYTYNGNNRPTKTKAPNGATTEMEYDESGRVKSQTDGNKHTTTYIRNVLGEVTEIKDPLARLTTEEYDAAGNLVAVTDAAKRTTKYVYDPANRPKEVVYSDGTTPTVKYEYDADGNRVGMTDGTGKSTYTYDILDRLVQSTDGNGDTVGYEYDLTGRQTKLTYPGGNMLTRAYDSDGRLQSVTDWLKNTTAFAYDPNSNLVKTTFPKATGGQDKVTYNQANQVLKITMVNGTKTIASLLYARGGDGQVKKTTTTGLPGAEATAYGYDANNRLTSAGATAYEYDAANNPAKTGSSINVYDAADELKTSGGTVYGYNQIGERTSAVKAALTTIDSYDQAGNLTQVKQASTGLNDLYTYSGDGLRAAQIKGKVATHLTWDTHAGLPLILSDEQNSYIYGPGGQPIEAIQSKGAVLYIHHDQQGSTRLLTGASGATEATATYDAYGNTTGTTGKVTIPLGYDGQYTTADTGLIYLRTRVYDPATAQFLSVDPLAMMTRAPYYYANDNPQSFMDPTGLVSLGEVGQIIGKAIGGPVGGVVGEFAFEHPVVVAAAGCTVGALAGPEVCVGAVAVSYTDSTAQNANDYYEGELNPEQLLDRQLGTAAVSAVGAIPSLPVLGTSAGEIIENAPIPIQLLVNAYLEGPDTVLSAYEQQILCGVGIL